MRNNRTIEAYSLPSVSHESEDSSYALRKKVETEIRKRVSFSALDVTQTNQGVRAEFLPASIKPQVKEVMNDFFRNDLDA